MVSNSDLEKWQKAIQDIEAKQAEMNPQEWSAFQTLKGLFSSGNFESDESGYNLKIIKDNLKQHDKHRLLQVHLKNFITLCEQNFTNKSVSFVQPQVSAPVFVQPPEIKPPTFQPPSNQGTKAPKLKKSKEALIVEPVINESTPPVPPVLPTSPISPIYVPDDMQEEKADNKKAKKGNKQLVLIIVTIALLVGASLIYKNWEPIRKWFIKKEVTTVPVAPNPLVTIGAWNGTLDDKPAIFQFLSIDTVEGKGKVQAQIYFPDNKRDTLKLSGTIDKYSIELKDDSIRYSGVLKPDTSIYFGTSYNNNGTSANFSFRNPKMPVDTLSENIMQSDTTLIAEPEKDSIAFVPDKTVSQPIISDNAVKKSHIQTSAPTSARLNNLLNKITNSDNDAIDEIRRVLGNNVSVVGAPNISNVQQLITDVSNGNHYNVTGVNRDAHGKVVSISVSK